MKVLKTIFLKPYLFLYDTFIYIKHVEQHKTDYTNYESYNEHHEDSKWRQKIRVEYGI